MIHYCVVPLYVRVLCVLVVWCGVLFPWSDGWEKVKVPKQRSLSLSLSESESDRRHNSTRKGDARRKEHITHNKMLPGNLRNAIRATSVAQ